MAKQRANLTSVGQFLGDTQQAYIKAPLVAAPFTSITDMSGAARRLPDPSQTLKPALGIERVMFRSVVLKQDETTALGQPVFEADSKDSRVRFVGNFVNVGAASGSYPQGQSINDFVEITFYGTGLNVLTILGGTTTDYRVSIDGGAEGTNVYPGGSSVLDARNYSSNSILNIASGLALGNHTVRIRRAVSTGYGLNIFGFEILNTSSSTIIIPKGSVIAAGQNATIAAQTSTAFNSGFDGNPTLNGRGGRVVMYATPEGRIGKVIQQVDATQLNLGSANHVNEEMIRRINYREFSANRADDFSTSLNGANLAFTLEDGTTTLVGSIVNTANGTSVAIQSGGFLTITFVGTGLDIYGNDTTSRPIAVSINGSSVGTVNTNTSGVQITKLVSGLPYGTHSVRLSIVSADIAVRDIIIYGPKKPAIPDNAVQIAEYNLMADYGVGTVTTSGNQADNNQMLQGILRKVSGRELTYVNTWTAGSVDTRVSNGLLVVSNTNSAYTEYTFFGSGFTLYLNRSSSVNVDYTVTVNGSLNASGVVLTTGSGTNLGGGTYRNLFSAAQDVGPVRIQFTGLGLGRHTVRVTKTAGTDNLAVSGFDLITPIHFPSNKVGSMSIGDLDLINKSAQKPVLDLSKAKAWVRYDQVNQRILSSFNVSAVLSVSAGIFDIFFEKPFKNNNYIAVGIGSNITGTNTWEAGGTGPRTSPSVFRGVTSNSNGVATSGAADFIFFGELEGE
jgi:hypothetical protein